MYVIIHRGNFLLFGHMGSKKERFSDNRTSHFLLILLNLPLLPPKVSRLPLSRLIIKGPQKTTTFDGSHEGGNPPYLTSKKRLNQSGGIEVSTV